MRPLTVALALIALLAVAMVALLWWRQEQMVFFPPGAVSPPGAALRIEFPAADGTRLHAYLVRPGGASTADARPPAGTPVVLHFHGNADLAAWQIGWAEEVGERTGAWVLAAEYRGYDGIAGRPTYAAVQEDAHTVARWLRDSLGVGAERLVVSGHSLGAAVAAEFAAEAHAAGAAPAALLLHSPFTTTREMAGRVVGPFAVVYPLIGRMRWNSAGAVREIPSRVHVVHGANDTVIPASMGQAVHAAARDPGGFLLSPGVGHGDVMQGADYWALVEAAIGTVGDTTRPR